MVSEEVTITTNPDHRYAEILTPEAIAFVVTLDREFGARRVQLLQRRRRRRATRTTGFDFLASTAAIRADLTWQVAAPPADLADRRVEIVSAPERATAVEALNSGARVWLADFADSTAPSWANVVLGQLCLRDAVAGTLACTGADGREHRVGATMPTIMVRPRGWQLPESHLRIGGRAVSAALFDFGLYLFHCGQRQLERGSGAYFSLPQLESHLEARLWNDVFLAAQRLLGLPRGTIRAAVPIETLTAAFELEEILYELREHSAGLTAGRSNYLSNMIKNRPNVALPERGQLSMTTPFLRAYTELLVSTCHRRGAHAIGELAAVVPSRDSVAAKRAVNQVRQDKRREVGDGFDGSAVAHPSLVDAGRDVFSQWLGEEPHQIVRRRDDVRVTAAELLDTRSFDVRVNEVALRTHVSVSLRYLAAWLGGRGSVPLGGWTVDTATAELCRMQLWQWISLATPTDYGVPVSAVLVTRMMREELDVLSETGALDEDAARRFGQARTLLTALLTERVCPESFTLPGYLRHVSSRSSTPETVRVTIAV